MCMQHTKCRGNRLLSITVKDNTRADENVPIRSGVCIVYTRCIVTFLAAHVCISSCMFIGRCQLILPAVIQISGTMAAAFEVLRIFLLVVLVPPWLSVRGQSGEYIPCKE